MTPSPVDLLTELIATPSVNPMGRDLTGEQFLETRLTDLLQSHFERLGLPWARQPVHPGRENIAIRLDGTTPLDAGGRLLLWEVHQDTVPVDGMTIEPFSPQVRDGRVTGRGACDVKGGMAAMLAAFGRLAIDRPPKLPTLVLACAVNEEFGFTGAKALAETWSGHTASDHPLSAILPRRPDAVIVAEPTDLNVVVAHKGAVRWFLHALGTAAHSSKPHLGDNAIYRLARAVTAIEHYATDALPTLPIHALCGQPTLAVTTLRGGLSSNTIPDRATVEIERRTLPDEEPMAARQAVIDYLAEALPSDAALLEHAAPSILGGGLSDTHNGPLAESLLARVRELVPKATRTGAVYGTDAAVIAPAGPPTVVFGPGSIDQAHTADEWIAIDQLEQATEILYRFAAEGG